MGNSDNSKRSDAEFHLLALRYLDGVCTEEEAAALSEALRSSPEHRAAFASLGVEVGILGEMCQAKYRDDSEIEPERKRGLLPAGLSQSGKWGKRFGSAKSYLQAAVLLLICVGLWAAWQENRELRGKLAAKLSAGEADPPIAYLAVANGCAWGDGEIPVIRKVGAAIETGDELTLHEGIAEFRLANGVYLSLEGPASLVLASPSSVLLQYGKVTTHVPRTVRDFRVLAAACRLSAHDAECGVSLAGGRLDVHVFSGEVRAISSLMATDMGDLLLNEGGSVVADDDGLFAKAIITAGRSLVLSSEGDALKVKEWGRVAPSMFATKLSASGALPITSEYVNAVRESKPAGYWRFESLESGMAKNEIDAGFDLKVIGDLKLSDGPQNRALASGHNPSHSYLISDKPLDALSGTDYSVEFWMKPSHFHRGGIVALMKNPDIERGQHALLLETLGSIGPYQSRRPNRLRFLHRDPPGADVATGTTCFSRSPYLARRWQHVVATKRDDYVRVYINGALAAKQPDSTYLTSNLFLIVGWTAGVNEDRHFFGQIDELAVYDRAMEKPEVVGHWKSVRWTPEEEPEDSI